MKAVIPAAGLGTRFLPVTKTVPKEMLPVVNIPMIQFAVEEARAAGIEDIIIVTNKNKTAIEKYFSDVSYVQQEQPLGLGHAIYTAKELVGNERFAVLLPDNIVDSPVPCIQQLMRFERPVVGVQSISGNDADKYGIINKKRSAESTSTERLFTGEEFVEKPGKIDGMVFAIIGRYILEPTLFRFLEDVEMHLTDALNKMKALAYWIEGIWYDVGNPEGLIQASIVYAKKEVKDIPMTEFKELEERIKQLDIRVQALEEAVDIKKLAQHVMEMLKNRIQRHHEI